MSSNKDRLLQKIRGGQELTRGEQLRLAVALSIPAMFAQLMHILMEYIDAAMVGSLGAQASASIGLVSTTTWLFGGLCHSVGAGFCVQVAHQIGANRFGEARNILRQGVLFCLLFSGILSVIGLSISHSLPFWLGGAEEICGDAGVYFMVFAGMLPLMMLMTICAGMLRSSGNVKMPSLLMGTACLLDIIFNWYFIFRLKMGVRGAAYGTALAYGLISLVMAGYLFVVGIVPKDVKNEELRIANDTQKTRRFSFFSSRILSKWWHIAWPMGAEHFVMCGAQITSTIIIAPLGTIAIAANSFGIIVESLCYMPGHGIADAATTLVGQSLGAQRKPLARSFARITVGLGIAVMTFMGLVMFLFAPEVMSLMTPDVTVQSLTSEVLRIEAFAEPMYAASIVCYGVFVGAGDTLIPCGMNLGSIWVVRITLALLFTKVLGWGLVGYWIAMALELCFRGTIFLWRLKGEKWAERFKV